MAGYDDLLTFCRVVNGYTGIEFIHCTTLYRKKNSADVFPITVALAADGGGER
jgi:hypothetical protein